MNRDGSLRLRHPGWILGASGVVAATLGLLVLAGWYSSNLRLTQLYFGLTPMAARSALSFLCLGSGLLAFVFGHRKASAALAVAVTLLNLLTLIAYASGAAIPFSDSLLAIPHILPAKAVAPNTAVVLVLLSVSLLLMCRTAYFRGRSILVGLMGSTGAAIAVTSLIGYLTGVGTFEWGRTVAMAPHTALGLVIVACGMLVFSWRDGRAGEPGPPEWLFVSATLAASLLAVALYHPLSEVTRAQTNQTIAADLEQARTNIVAQMRVRTELLSRAARRWEQRGEPNREEWEFEAGLLLSDLLDFQAVEWVDPNLHIRWVAPARGNERLRNADLGIEARRRQALDTARSQRRAVLTRTVDLLTGGRGIQIYVPVFEGEVCRGFVVGAFLVDELLPKLLPRIDAPDEQVAVFDGDEPMFTRTNPDGDESRHWAQSLTIDLGGARWTVRMWPTPQKLSELRSSIPQAVLFGGLMLSALVGASVFLAQRAWGRTRAAELLRRRMEKEVGERIQAVRQLDQFFELSLEILCVAGYDCRFQRVNPACEQILGYSPEELMADSFLSFVHPEDRERTTLAMQQLASGKPLTSFENRYRARDGSYRWLQWACAPAQDQPVTFASARDITERIEAQAALERAHAELEDRVRERTAALEQTNRALNHSRLEVLKLNQQLEKRLRDLSVSNQELEAFTYSVSHDLRAPLRHIDGFSKILLEDYGPRLPEGARPLLDRVRQGSQRMGRMVDELLELSRTTRRAPEKRLTGLRLMVDEVIADLATETADRQVEWRIGELPFSDCDPALTRQIFVNLLSNALKFTRTRQKAVIEVGQVGAEGGPAVFVRDNGVGFSMKYADKLFGVFQRLHRQEDFEGTGVGLATVQRIVHKHGGRIWAEAALDQGAAFYFTLSPESSASHVGEQTAGTEEEVDVTK